MLIVDGYTRFILTVIAAALLLIAARPYLEPRDAHAAADYVRVDLATVGGKSIGVSNSVPVAIVSPVSVEK